MKCHWQCCHYQKLAALPSADDLGHCIIADSGIMCVEEIACKTFKESYENNDDVHAIRLDR